MADSMELSETTENPLESAKAKFTAESEKMYSFIEDYIAGEKYLDDLARILIYVGIEKADQTLEKCPPELSGKIKERLTKIALNGNGLKKDSPEVLSSVGTVLRKSGFFGFNSVDSLMGELTTGEQKAFAQNTDDFFAINPILTMNAEENLFKFEDIIMMDDRAVQKVLREVDQQELARALKGADAEAQDKIFRNMSRRAANMLQEDMEFMGPVRIKDVEDSQTRIVKIIRRLEAAGEIVIARSKEDEMIV